MKNKLKFLVSFIFILLLLVSCLDKNNNIEKMKANPFINNEIIVPIKLPSLPFVLQYDSNEISYNKTDNVITKLSAIKIDNKRGPYGNAVPATEYHDEYFDKFRVITPEVDDENINDDDYGLKTYVPKYGVYEIIKFDNRIIKNYSSNRCNGTLYYQVKILKKGEFYYIPKFKIKDLDGLVMYINEKYPSLINLSEGEISEGEIRVIDQPYSDTYELIIE